MALEVKIVRFNLNDRKEMDSAEQQLAELLNNQWSIILNGESDAHVYIVLQKGQADKKRPLSML